MLSRDEILASNDSDIHEVEVPEWGGSVHIRVMSGLDRDAFEQSLADKTNIRARLCVLTLCDQSGKLLFGNGDEARLGAKSGQALDRIFERSAALNGLSKQGIEEIEKKSAPAPGNGLLSDSPEPSAALAASS